METKEQMRAEFEEWASNVGKWPKAIEKDELGNYQLMQTYLYWSAWSAAWQAALANVTGKAAREQAMQALVDISQELEAEQPQPSGWYCAHCKRGVDPSEVTYNESHTVCGRIITNDEQPKPTQPSGEQRADFEAWVESEPFFAMHRSEIERDTQDGGYLDANVHAAWMAVQRFGQSALASQAAEPGGEVESDRYGQSIPMLYGEYPVGTKLYARPQPAAQCVPEGWQLVPIKPTPVMGHAGEDALVDTDSAWAIWAEMLAAAPTWEAKP